MPRFLKYFITCLAILVLSCGGKSTTSSKEPVAEDGSSGYSGSDDSAASSLGSGNYLNSLTFPFEEIENASVTDVTPPLTDPHFVLPESPDATYLEDTDLVIGVHLNGESRAYPHKIGLYHEIVNDLIGGTPIAVTFSPLSDSEISFGTRGEADNDRILFGVTGQLFDNNLVCTTRMMIRFGTLR